MESCVGSGLDYLWQAFGTIMMLLCKFNLEEQCCNNK